MWRWTFKSLISEPSKLFVSIAAAGFAFLLVLFFEAVYVGETRQVVAYVQHADADIWVMQSGVSNMHMATSYLADWKVDQVRKLPGVAEVDGILYLNTVVESGGNKWFAYIVGMNTFSSLAGPWSMSQGRAKPALGEAVVPQVFARTSGLELGGTIRITDREFSIVGFSKGTFSIANSVIFVTKQDLEDIMTSLDIVSFMLVKADPGVDLDMLSAEIEREVEKVHALPAARFLANDKHMAMQMGVETIALMTVIGSVLAVLLIAFTIYSRVNRQKQELAVTKALGATNPSLYLSVLLQALIITLASILLATGLAWIAVPLVPVLIPEVTLELTLSSVARIAAIGVLVALAASLVPARKIAQVDPLSAFQE